MKRLIVLCLICGAANFSCRNGYQKFPAHFDQSDSLIKTIIPNKNYTYWAFCDFFNRVIYSNGEKPAHVNFKTNGSNLFVSTGLMYNYRYIEYVDNGRVGYITDTDAFKNFLMPINNLQKATLLAECDGGLLIDDNNKNGGSYLIKDNVYNLKFASVTSCPGTWRSIYIEIKIDSGIVKKQNLGVYYQSKNCYIE